MKDECIFSKDNVCQITKFVIDKIQCNNCANYEPKKRCSVCNEYIEDGKDFYHKYDIGQIENPICESCWNDETI